MPDEKSVQSVQDIADIFKESDDVKISGKEEDFKNWPDYLTSQQRKRDQETTKLYEQFVKSHEDKQEFARKSKEYIRNSCFVWVIVLILTCAGLSWYVIACTERSINDIAALISALVPITVAIIGTLNIVTKYVFPEDEEKNITEIVKLIHTNDLANKQENLKQRERKTGGSS